FAGDSLRATVEARYLFGAPMARAAASWVARQQPISPWALHIPGTDGYYIGEAGWWWEEDWEESVPQANVTVVATGTDTLDASGHLTLRVAVAPPAKGLPARATLQATVTDVNRQSVSGAASVTVHPAAFYLAAKPLGKNYFWTAGSPQEVAVITVRPDGRRVAGVAIHGTIVRREWHQVVRERAGLSEEVGDWVSDAEAWVTVEREGLIEERRLHIAGGATTLKFPIREAYAPNAFVSIVVARGRSAAPGTLADPGRPTIRVGYAELRVTPEVKRLEV